MRILMLARFCCSGSTGHVLSLAGELNRMGLYTALGMTDCPAPHKEAYAAYCRSRVPFYAENSEAELGRFIRQQRIKLLHLHTPALLPLARKICQRHSLPWGISIHSESLAAALAQPAALAQAAFITTADPAAYSAITASGFPARYIPEGIDLAQFQPGPKNELKLTYIAETGGYDENSWLVLLKAAGLADLTVEIISPERFPQISGRFHGWPPSAAALLRGSSIVAGRRRSLLEGMACGNAALILGRSYGGVLEPDAARTARPDLSGEGTGEPCYRDIFYDLSRLIKNRPYLSALQQWGRQYTLDNCDLKQSARLTAQVYGDR
jgi:hypothetical protein